MLGILITFVVIWAGTCLGFAIIRSRRKEYIWALDPFMFLSVSVFFTYIFPGVYINGAFRRDVAIINTQVIVFHVLTGALTLWLCRGYPRPRAAGQSFDLRPATRVMYAAAVVFWLGSLTSGLPSISLLVDRMLNPRDYTYIREGQGPITFLSIITTYIATFIAMRKAWTKRNAASVATAVLLSGITLLGGGKSSIFSILICGIFAALASNIRVGFKTTVCLVAIGVGLLLLSFGIYQRSGARTMDVQRMYDRLVSYQEELKISALMREGVEQNAGRFLTHAMINTCVTPIPRAIYPTKPSGGLYSAFVNEDNRISSDEAHYATSGLQLEGMLVIGHMWPVVYALFFASVFAYPYWADDGSADIFFMKLGWISLLVFGFVRGGIFYTTPWMLILMFAAIYALKRVGVLRLVRCAPAIGYRQSSAGAKRLLRTYVRKDTAQMRQH